MISRTCIIIKCCLTKTVVLMLTSIFLTWLSYSNYCQWLLSSYYFCYCDSLSLLLMTILCYMILLITVIAVSLKLFFTLSVLKLFLTSMLWVSSHCVKIYWLKFIVLVMFWSLLFFLLHLSSNYYWYLVIMFLQFLFIHSVVNLYNSSNHSLKCCQLFFSDYVILNYILQISIELLCKSCIIST